MVPAPVRNEVWQAYRATLYPGGKTPEKLEALAAAQKKAIQCVVEKEIKCKQTP